MKEKSVHRARLTVNGGRFLVVGFFSLVLGSCSLQKKIGALAGKELYAIPSLQTAHIGVSVFEPASSKFWYNYQGEHYFVPASNTKIFTCYAAMKYLGDSLTGIHYTESNNELFLVPTGDPTLLHQDFKEHPVMTFLKNSNKHIVITAANWKEEALGPGWSWDDYNYPYSAERSPLPLYGNLIRFVQTQITENNGSTPDSSQFSTYTIPDINWKVNFSADTGGKQFSVVRKRAENIFSVTQGTEKYKELEVPYATQGMLSALELLKDTVGKDLEIRTFKTQNSKWRSIKSQPTDSLLTPMMHRSDNFFAEQTLLMVSNELLGSMNDGRIIDTLLRSDLKDLPQRPSWVDGSGLSRFNLFTPQDFVWILSKMKNEFSWKRITTILPTGNEGTLRNYYKADSGYIYAKTGSLSGQVAISGYLITKKNKTLIFSVLINNHQSTAATVRRAVERFINQLREEY